MAKLVKNGETARNLRRMIRTERSTPDGRRNIYPTTMALLKNMARPEEIFARGYTEWVCRESGHERLSELMNYANHHTFSGYGLSDGDRKKFREMMGKELQKKQWQ